MGRTFRRTQRMTALFGSPLQDLEDTAIPCFLQPQTTASQSSPGWNLPEDENSAEVTVCSPTANRYAFQQNQSGTRLTNTQKEVGERITEHSLSPVPVYSHHSPTIFQSKEADLPRTPGCNIFSGSPLRDKNWSPTLNSPPSFTFTEEEKASWQDGEHPSISVFIFTPSLASRGCSPVVADWPFVSQDSPSKGTYFPPTPGRNLYSESPLGDHDWYFTRYFPPSVTYSENGESIERIKEHSPMSISSSPCVISIGYQSDGVDCPPTPGRNIITENPSTFQFWSPTRNTPPLLTNTETVEATESIAEHPPSPVPAYSLKSTSPDHPPEEANSSSASRDYISKGTPKSGGEKSRLRGQDCPSSQNSPPPTNYTNDETTECIGEHPTMLVSTFPLRVHNMNYPQEYGECLRTAGSDLFTDKSSMFQFWSPTLQSPSPLTNTENKQSTGLNEEGSSLPLQTTHNAASVPLHDVDCPPTPGRDLFPDSPTLFQISSPVLNSLPSFTRRENEDTEWFSALSPTSNLTFSFILTNRDIPTEGGGSSPHSRDYLSQGASFPPTPGRDLFPESPLGD